VDFGCLRLFQASIPSRSTEPLPGGFEELVTPFHLSISFLVCPCKPFLPHLGSYPNTGYGLLCDRPRVGVTSFQDSCTKL
jgi:hypothetical protein